MTARKTTAREVRTGDTIQTAWSPQGEALTVDYPTLDRFTNPEGATFDRIRFTGTDSLGRHVELGWGVNADSLVCVVEEAPRDGDSFGALSEWIDPNYEVPNDAWLDNEDSLELL